VLSLGSFPGFGRVIADPTTPESKVFPLSVIVDPFVVPNIRSFLSLVLLHRRDGHRLTRAKHASLFSLTQLIDHNGFLET
jgi:hypothetical protein